MTKVHASRTAVLLCIGLISCVTQRPAFIEAPKPPASAKLRVFVQPLEDGYNWRTPYPQFKLLTFEKVKKVWSNTGIYEAVSLDEADSALGKSRAKLRWKADGYALAIEAARALWADYAMLVERLGQGGDFRWSTTLINARTGAVFKVTLSVPGGGSREDFQPVIEAAYRQLFQDARADMMATADYRRRGGEPPRRTAGLTAAGPEISRDLVFREPTTPSSALPAVVVYDIKALEGDRIVASILSEALRAELLATQRLRLVSRENIEEVLKEMEFQLSGIVDERAAVKAGQGLAAQQIIVGQFGAVGKVSVLQAKRIDVATQRTLGAGNIRCETGREDQLLDAMAVLVRQLSAEL